MNTPASRNEAAVLMDAIDSKGRDLGWPPEVLRNVRRSMKGRLLAAGMREQEVEKWIASLPLGTREVQEMLEKGRPE